MDFSTNTNMADNIIKILQFLGNQLGLGVTLTKDNVLPYLTQLSEKYIKYRVATREFYIIICAIVIAVGIAFLIKGYVISSEDWVIFGFILIAIGGFPCCIFIHDIIECKYFPEKVIFDYVQKQLSSINGR